MEKKDYFELHPSLKPLRFKDMLKYIAQREVDEDEIGFISKNGRFYNFVRNSFRIDEIKEWLGELAPNYTKDFGSEIINKDKFLNAKGIHWSIPDIRKYNHRYTWCPIVNNAPLEIDGKIMVIGVLPTLLELMKVLELKLDGVVPIDKWATWDYNPLAYKVYNYTNIWSYYLLEGIELNDEDKKQLVELKVDVGIAWNDSSEIRTFKPGKQEHSIESVYTIKYESITGPSVIGAVLFSYLDKIEEPGKDLTELIKENQQDIDYLYQVHRCDNRGAMSTILSIHHYLSNCKGLFPINTTINNKGKVFLTGEYPSDRCPVIYKEDIEKDLDLTGIDYKECGLTPLGQSLLNPKAGEFLLITNGMYTDENKNVWLKAPCVYKLNDDLISGISSHFVSFHNDDGTLVTMNKDGGLLYSRLGFWSMDEVYSSTPGITSDMLKALFDSGKVKGPYIDNGGSVYLLYRLSQPEVV